jgi:hypothetical protein
MRPSAVLLFLFCAVGAIAEDSLYDLGGHSKLRLVGQSYPDDSLLRDLVGATSLDAAGELRLNFSSRRQDWSFHADYQLLGIYSEFLPFGQPDDEGRLLDLTRVITDGSDYAWVHRLDRFWVGYAGDKLVLQAGRQALSWGNGLFFHPLDLVLYGQYLRDNGDDWQGAAVFRRDPVTGNTSSAAGTRAIKYHGFAGEYEYDVLVAEHLGDTVVGIGAAGSIGGAVLRAGLVASDADAGTEFQFVTNISYSWIWGERNISGAGEYYRSADDRNYVAGSLMVEMSPLWIVTPTLIGNLDDPSALLQFVTQYSLGDNLTFLGSINLPLGGNGTEFGGPETGIPGRFLSYDVGAFAQLAWYF